MCIIIYNPKGKKLKDYVIDNSLYDNPHGYGFYDIDARELKRTMDDTEMESWIRKGKRYVAHCRYATRGEITVDNIHPFECGDWLVFMNGTVDGLADEKSNDTAQIADMLKHVPSKAYEKLLSLFSARFLLINTRNGRVIRTGNWHKANGVWYSKKSVLDNRWDWIRDYHDNDAWNSWYLPKQSTRDKATSRAKSKAKSAKPKVKSKPKAKPVAFDPEYGWVDTITPRKGKHFLAVYGTLKRGNSNHRHYLNDSLFVDECFTEEPYRLVIDGLPYLLTESHPAGDHVSMELYEIDDDTLTSIDGLEGHPHFYCREKIDVITNAGEYVSAWVYTVPEEYDRGEYHSCFPAETKFYPHVV